MITNNNIRRTGVKLVMSTRALLIASLITYHLSLNLCPAVAQTGMVTEIKILALNYFKELAENSGGYYGGSGDDAAKLDFRKGKGGGYVFAVFKYGAAQSDTTNYITDVVVTKNRGAEYGLEYDADGKHYTPAHYFQEQNRHKDDNYRGGLNGRNYWCYGGAYTGQDHVYVSRTGNTDFSKRVLKEAKVVTSKPDNLKKNQTYSGGHAGGGRYFVFTWHTHESKYNATGDLNYHERYCDRDQCGLFKSERHRFAQRYGNDIWGQLPEGDAKRAKSHYKKCLDCGQVIYTDHEFSTFVSNSLDHNERCLLCGYVKTANHKGFGNQKIPVDENEHVIYCDECQFMRRFPHDFSYNRSEKHRDCERTLVEYTCSQCYHHAIFEEPGAGHDYDAYGICRTEGCLHPYQQPATKPLAGGDSTYVVRNFGNLYWIADRVNNRRPKTNVYVDNDLIAPDFVSRPWRPIGATDSTAFQGTFDGGGHVISMLQTEEPVAGCGYRGLFGAIAEGAVVRDVTLAGFVVRGWDNIGAVAGVNNGTIENCNVIFSMMSTIGTGKNLGGICGLNKGTITGCTTEKTVWVGGVQDYAGGICGTNAGGTLSGNTFAAICGSGSDAVLPETASQQ